MDLDNSITSLYKANEKHCIEMDTMPFRPAADCRHDLHSAPVQKNWFALKLFAPAGSTGLGLPQAD